MRIPSLAGLTAAALIASLPLTAPATANAATWKIDPSHVAVAFTVSHIGFADTLGLFREVEGTIEYDEETQTLGAVNVSIDAASVWSNHEKRDDHIRNADFLDVKNHPEITFVATGSEQTSENTGTVSGDLTVLGVTKPVTLDVTLNKIGEYPFGHKKRVIGASVTGTIKRSEFGMTYALGGIVGDEVDVAIEIEAIIED
ncbi:MAG: YceI family protein [Pseudomonadota bacterium]